MNSGGNKSMTMQAALETAYSEWNKEKSGGGGAGGECSTPPTATSSLNDVPAADVIQLPAAVDKHAGLCLKSVSTLKFKSILYLVLLVFNFKNRWWRAQASRSRNQTPTRLI